MANILFCIEVHRDKLLAVKLAAGPYVNLVIGCGAVKTNIWPLDQAITRLKEEVGFEEGRVFLTFSPDLLLVRNLKVPFADKKKIEQILPMEIVESLPVDLDGLLVDFLISKQTDEGAEIVVSMLPKELLSTILDGLSAEGIKPETVGVGGMATCLNLVDDGVENFLLLDLQAKGVGIYIFEQGQVGLIRSVPINVKKGGVKRIIDEIMHTLFASGYSTGIGPESVIYLTGFSSLQDAVAKPLKKELGDVDIRIFRQSKQPFTKINNVIQEQYHSGIMDGALSVTVREGNVDGDFNYLKNEFKQRTGTIDYRRILTYAAPAIVCILLLIGYQVVSYKKLALRQDALKSQIVSVFKETLPQSTRIVNPVHQLQIINKDMGTTYGAGGVRGEDGYSMIDLLTEISARIPVSYKVKIVRLVADLETMRIRGLTTDFNTVDSIQKELQKSDLFSEVDINSANQSGKNDEVRFEMKLLLAK